MKRPRLETDCRMRLKRMAAVLITSSAMAVLRSGGHSRVRAAMTPASPEQEVGQKLNGKRRALDDDLRNRELGQGRLVDEQKGAQQNEEGGGHAGEHAALVAVVKYRSHHGGEQCAGGQDGGERLGTDDAHIAPEAQWGSRRRPTAFSTGNKMTKAMNPARSVTGSFHSVDVGRPSTWASALVAVMRQAPQPMTATASAAICSSVPRAPHRPRQRPSARGCPPGRSPRGRASPGEPVSAG